VLTSPTQRCAQATAYHVPPLYKSSSSPPAILLALQQATGRVQEPQSTTSWCCESAACILCCGLHLTQHLRLPPQAALWSRRPTKRRSVPVPEAGALAAEAAEAAGGLWPPQHRQAHQDLGFGATLGPPAMGSPNSWADGQPLHRSQQHPPPLVG
jgi:hypothetical protein